MVMAGGLAIVLSGGGAKGAFQAGVLQGLISRKKVNFETAVGTSTGAIQAAAVAQDDIPALVKFWTDLKGPGDIYKSRGGKLLDILTGKPSLYATEPLQNLLMAAINEQKIRATGKKLRIRVVNITNGKAITVAENANNLAQWVYASCAMPFVFPPQLSKDAQGVEEQWVDGGVRDVTPLDEAMLERPRAILVVRAGGPPKPDQPKKYKSLVDIGLRAVDIQHSEVSENDLKNVQLINNLLTARDRQLIALRQLGLTAAQTGDVMRPLQAEIDRYRLVPVKVIAPEQDLYGTLDFNPADIKAAIAMGDKLVEDSWPELQQFLGV
jgi:NTE family protein